MLKRSQRSAAVGVAALVAAFLAGALLNGYVFASEPPRMKQFIIFLEPAREGMATEPTPEEGRVVGEHFQYLQRLTKQGVVHLAGRTMEDNPVGIVILEAESEEAARAVMEGDPTIQHGVFKGRLAPFGIALQRSPRAAH